LEQGSFVPVEHDLGYSHSAGSRTLHRFAAAFIVQTFNKENERSTNENCSNFTLFWTLCFVPGISLNIAYVVHLALVQCAKQSGINNYINNYFAMNKALHQCVLCGKSVATILHGTVCALKFREFLILKKLSFIIYHL
jgi:hypothetical protein